MSLREFATTDMERIVENIVEDGEWAILKWRDPNEMRGCGGIHVTGGKIRFQRGYWNRLSFRQAG